MAVAATAAIVGISMRLDSFLEIRNIFMIISYLSILGLSFLISFPYRAS